MKVDTIFGDLVFITSKDLNHFVRYYQSKNFSPKFIAKGIMPAHPTLFLRKAVYEKYGYFKTDYRIAADFEFVFRIFKDYHVSYDYIPKILVKMRTGGTSVRRTFSAFQQMTLSQNRLAY